MRPDVAVKTQDGAAEVRKYLAQLMADEVLVGIPESRNASSHHRKIGNAALLFIHSNGSPLRKIPARRVIEPAIMAPDNRKRITGTLSQAAQSELSGDHDGAMKLLATAGLQGANASKRWFTDPRNGWPSNKPATILRKLGGKSASKLRGAAKLKVLAAIDSGQSLEDFDTTLVEYGDMRRAITYVVRDGAFLAGTIGQQPRERIGP